MESVLANMIFTELLLIYYPLEVSRMSIAVWEY